MNSKTLVIAGTIVILVVVSGCTKHIQEPWVPNANYLESERNRTPDLNQALDNRALYQKDR